MLVLEAGEPNLDDPKILLGGQLGVTWGDKKVCTMINDYSPFHLTRKDCSMTGALRPCPRRIWTTALSVGTEAKASVRD